MSTNQSPSHGADPVEKEATAYSDPKNTREHTEDTMVELREAYVKSG